jgi:2-dehydropantoate 2-reductase
VRYVVYGPGAIGGTIGGALHQAGRPVVLIARGRQLEALRADGLTLQAPEGERRLPILAVASPREVAIARDDVVFLTMKSQDTCAALKELSAVADPRVAVVCAQNGVENERLALRCFVNVYGAFVWVTAQHLEPGVVQIFSEPRLGVLDLGRAPRGADGCARTIARDLQTAGFRFAGGPRDHALEVREAAPKPRQCRRGAVGAA